MECSKHLQQLRQFQSRGRIVHTLTHRVGISHRLLIHEGEAGKLIGGGGMVVPPASPMRGIGSEARLTWTTITLHRPCGRYCPRCCHR